MSEPQAEMMPKQPGLFSTLNEQLSFGISFWIISTGLTLFFILALEKQVVNHYKTRKERHKAFMEVIMIPIDQMCLGIFVALPITVFGWEIQKEIQVWWDNLCACLFTS